MKKIIYLMAAFAAITLTTACNEKKHVVGSELEIKLQVYKDGQLVFEDKDVDWKLRLQEDETYTLFMNKTRFVEAMPMLDMEVRGLVNQSPSMQYAFLFDTDSIIPYYNGEEFPRYVMTDFFCAIYLSQDVLIEFDCAGYHVAYTEVWNDIFE